ncbi:MAG: peptidylprolyl isomerase [Flavobacteriales bacterium]|nr:peptidylprolyl isomerase [Flavobacteriales bacterium]
MFKQITLFLFSGLLLFGCKEDEAITPDTNPVVEEKEDIIRISTEYGDMLLYLYKGTPQHRANFLSLVESGFYNNTEFHRIVPNFVIQGGDPNSKDDDRGNDGTGGPGYTVPAEINSKYTHVYGAVGAARQGDAVNPKRDSNGSQFYIVTTKVGTPSLNGAYTVFGIIFHGMEAATAIVSQPRNSKDLPDKRIPMQMEKVQMTLGALKADYGFDPGE